MIWANRIRPYYNLHRKLLGAIIRGYKGATTKRIRALYLSKTSNNDKKNTSTGELYSPCNKNELHPPANNNSGIIIDPTQSIWHRNYYEHIIRDERAYNNISNYIIMNPAKWQKDKFRKL